MNRRQTKELSMSQMLNVICDAYLISLDRVSNNDTSMLDIYIASKNCLERIADVLGDVEINDPTVLYAIEVVRFNRKNGGTLDAFSPHQDFIENGTSLLELH